MRKRTIGRSRARSKRRKGGKKRRSQGGGMGDAELRALIGAYIAEGSDATLKVEGDDIQAAFRIFKEEHLRHKALLKANAAKFAPRQELMPSAPPPYQAHSSEAHSSEDLSAIQSELSQLRAELGVEGGGDSVEPV